MLIPERLYHYTSRQTALEYILPSRRIQLGSLGLTNDPRETQIWGFSVMNPPDQLTLNAHSLMSDLQRIANRIRLEEWWVLSLSRDDHDLIQPGPNQVDVTYSRYGYARACLWAHYAEKHKGVCLEFDGPKLHDAIIEAAASKEDVFFGDVEYSNEFNLGNLRKRGMAFQIPYQRLFELGLEGGLRDHIRTQHRLFFLEKALDWKSESEFRWLVNARSGPIRADISRSLTSVIAGIDFPKVYGPTMLALCEDLGIKLECVSWNNRVPVKSQWEVRC